MIYKIDGQTQNKYQIGWSDEQIKVLYYLLFYTIPRNKSKKWLLNS